MVKKLSVALASVGGLLLTGGSVFAAADTDVLGAASSTIGTLKENILGVVSANIVNIAVVAAAILGIFIVWKILRRMTGR